MKILFYGLQLNCNGKARAFRKCNFLIIILIIKEIWRRQRFKKRGAGIEIDRLKMTKLEEGLVGFFCPGFLPSAAENEES